jgi:RimJ/RimL family protein N-acetyltransferase
MPAVPLPLRTERLVLRAWATGDVDDIHAYRSREDVTRWLLFGPQPRERIAEMVVERAAMTTVEADGAWVHLVVEHEARVIGDLTLKWGALQDAQAEIGWVFHPDVQGQGFARESAAALRDVAFDVLGAHRVHAALDPRNERSARLCASLGMRQEAHLREESWFKGEWGDLAIWAMLAHERP